jgi:ribonuclease III
VTDDRVDELLARLGVPIADPSLYRRALTHRSWALDHGEEDNERLEFLGDAVLAWVVASRLYRDFPDAPEGDLTRMKIALTSGRTLAAVARELDLGSALRLGRGAEHQTTRASVLEDALEALIGAMYLDAGLDATRTFVLRILGERIDRDTLLATRADAKNRLQEFAQSTGSGLPSYSIVESSGPVHDPLFTATVSLNGIVRGRGQGPTKQRAERAAAAAALEVLGQD